MKTREGLREALERVAAMGYQGVQISAVAALDWDVTADEVGKWLRDLGLECVVTHRRFDHLEAQSEQEVEFHRALGCDYVAIGAPPPWAIGSYAGFQELIQRLEDVAARLAPLRVGYHNHALEFERFPEGRPIDLLRTSSLPLILDTYWVHMGGNDVASFIRTWPGRLPVVHVKDLGNFGWETTFAPVGEGNLDWDSILPAFREAGTEWLVVEQDTCRRDPFDCLESSFRFLRERV